MDVAEPQADINSEAAIHTKAAVSGEIDINGEIAKYRNKVPYMDIQYTAGSETKIGRVRFELFWDDAPITTVNFVKLLTEPEDKPRFLGCPFHRIIPDFMMQGGDFTMRNGMGGQSIYGTEFEDEEFVHKHGPGVLSMANRGKNTNTSQFFITFKKQPHLDGMHVVFGRMRDPASLDVIKEIEGIRIRGGSIPVDPVRIVKCGVEDGAVEEEAAKEDVAEEGDAYDSGIEEGSFGEDSFEDSSFGAESGDHNIL